MLEIIAKVESLGPISDDRRQTIQLSEVASMMGDYCQGEMRSILFLTPEEQRAVKGFLKDWRESQ